jgi:YidC/Oxa1 family membrane protein insertase
MTSDNRNIILAIVLSVAIIVAWQYFFAQPMIEQQRQQQEMAERARRRWSPDCAGRDSAAGPVQALPGPAASREAALAASPRLPIDTPSLTGSINLQGGLIDDLQLKNYRTTVEPGSPIVTLLSPANAPGGFFIDQGWTPAPGSRIEVPQPHTVWSAPPGGADARAAGHHDLDQRIRHHLPAHHLGRPGLSVHRAARNVMNGSRDAAVLYPYSRIKRHGIPPMENIFIVHEGLIGVFDEVLQEVDYSDVQGEAAADDLRHGRRLARHDGQVLGRDRHPRSDHRHHRRVPPQRRRRPGCVPDRLHRPGTAHRSGRGYGIGGKPGVRRRQGGRHRQPMPTSTTSCCSTG